MLPKMRIDELVTVCVCVCVQSEEEEEDKKIVCRKSTLYA